MYSKSIATFALLAISAHALPQRAAGTGLFDFTGTSPSSNGVGNSDGKNVVDGLLNNPEVLKAAGIANGAVNGATVLNGNQIKPNVISAGNAGNDGNGGLAVDAVTTRAEVQELSAPTTIDTPVADVPIAALPVAAVPVVGDVDHSKDDEGRDGVLGNVISTILGENSNSERRDGSDSDEHNTVAVLPGTASTSSTTGTIARPVAVAAAPVAPAVQAARAQGLSPSANGLGNGGGKSGLDGLLNNGEVLFGAGIANGAVNGLTGLNGNELKPNLVQGGDAGNDRNVASSVVA